jgi:hypothetical protein
MLYKSKMRQLICLISFLVFLSSCNDSHEPVAGTYEGTLIEAGASYAVEALLSRDSGGNIHLKIQGYPEIHEELDLVLGDSGHKVQVRGSHFSSLALYAQGDCFEAQDDSKTKLCGQTQSLVLVSGAPGPTYSLSLTLSSTLTGGSVELEKPKLFTLEEAVAESMRKEFNTQIEFQHRLQARFAAKQALAGLLPSLQGGVLVGLQSAPLTTLDILAMGSNLVPFLLPSRWIEAHQSGVLSDAESDALALMRGAAGLQVENMAYAIDHDAKLFKFLNEDYTRLLGLSSLVRQQEDRHLIPEGSTAHFASILNDLHDGLDDIQTGIDLQKEALAQAMGMVNPNGVLDIAVPDFPRLNNPDDLKWQDLQEFVLDRAPELKQIDHLIQGAQLGKEADFFSWLDPAADISHSLGFGTGSTLKIDGSQIETLRIQRVQSQSSLLQLLASAVTSYNHSVDDLRDSEEGLQLENSRWEKMIVQLQNGIAISPTELTSIPQDRLRWQIHLLDARLEYRSSQAKFQRLLLQGFYSNLYEKK